MKKMNSYLTHGLFLASMAVFVSCQNNEPELSSALVAHSSDHLVTLDEALNNANDMFELIGKKRTRSSSDVKSVKMFRCATRSEDATDMHGFYVVNYGNDEGFALLSADNRRAAVYAISEEGALNLSDTLTNDGLSWYLNNFIPTIDAEILPLLNGHEPPTPPVLPPLNPNWVYYENYTDPLITGFMSQFHQGSPFNYYCNGNLIGCLPLAMGTIMGFYGWPLSHNNYHFDWTSMYATRYHSSWAYLFKDLGSNENLNAIYGPDKTPSFWSAVINTFLNYGYKSPTERASSEVNEVNTYLKAGNPILCCGIIDSNHNDNHNDDDYAHAWVIDGGYVKGMYEHGITPEDPGKYVYHTYYHCIWGYGGKSNGYYYYYNGLGGTASSYDSDTTELGINYPILRFVYGFTPDK